MSAPAPLAPRAPRRVPLATGATAFHAVFIGALGGAVLGFTTAYVTRRHAHEALDQDVMLGAFVASFVAFAYTCLAIPGAVRGSASDIVLSDEGFEIVGGRWSGLKRSWAAIDPANVRLGKHALIVGEQLIAESYDRHEREALGTIASVIVAASSPRPETPASNGGVGSFRCAGCGALLVPADVDAVACPHCSAKQPMAVEVRERIRAARELDADGRRVERLAKRLAQTPSPARTNTLLAISGVIFLGSVALAAFGYEIGSGAAVLAAIAASLPLLTFVRLDIADRTGAILLATGSAARDPERPGDPYACGSCGAPLPDAAAGSLVVRCAFCRANNVLGLDLRVDAGAARWSRGWLEVALAHRRRGEIWRVVALVAAIALLGVAFRARAVRAAAGPDPYDCIHGSDDACFAYCTDASPFECYTTIGSLIRAGEHARVVRLWSRQCEQQKNTYACSEAFDALAAGGHVTKNLAEAVRLAAIGCAVDSKELCLEAAGAYVDGQGVAKDLSKALPLYARECALEHRQQCPCAQEDLDEEERIMTCGGWPVLIEEPDDFRTKSK